MLKYEDQCVNCQLPCLGNSCPYKNVPVYYCDECKETCALCYIDGNVLCTDCAKEYLQESFDNLSIKEKSYILEANYSELSL